MPADYANTLGVVQKAIALAMPHALAWAEVAAHLNSGREGTPLQLPDLNLEDELRHIETWLLETLVTKPPARTIRGLRFGLFHPELNGRPSCDLYLAGSRSFDADSGAWGYDQDYRAPTEPRSRALDALYLIASDDQHQADGAVVHLCLWFALLAIAELCRRHSAAIRGTAARRGIGVGFDSGDLIIVGVHSASGFKPQPLEKPTRKPKRPKLPAGEYFHIEGGRDVLLCNCTDESLSRDLFQCAGPIAPISLTATIHADWPNQRGTFGTIYPFCCEIIPATIAQHIADTFPDEVQFHPLAIVGRPEAWCVLKVLNCVQCYNHEVTQRESRLTLSRAPIADHNFFFVYGYYEYKAVFVSRRAAQLLIDQGVTGIEFRRIEMC
ncbi:MAG: hypothetical protein JWN70_4403 [Planctomycetaceae bacterium]|nr:hypothetical protein [Planctomycetaceae bacterium]